MPGFRDIGLSLTGARATSHRHATHPINAILNYGCSMLAGQVERAAVTRGLDVAVGSLHADTDGRPSLAYDLMIRCGRCLMG